jgi:TolA-binding protein
MSAFPMQEKKDALQPNEQEVDLDAVWVKFRVWVYALLGGLILLAGGTWFYFNMKERAERTELEAQAILNGALDEQAILSLVERYPETDASAQALLLLAYRDYIQQNWGGMREFYQKLYERDGQRHPDLGAAALFGVGVSYEAERNWDKALESYALLTRTYPASYKAPEAKIAVARVHEARGEFDQARQLYENVLVSYPKSQWRAKVDQRLKILGAKTAQ